MAADAGTRATSRIATLKLGQRTCLSLAKDDEGTRRGALVVTAVACCRLTPRLASTVACCWVQIRLASTVACCWVMIRLAIAVAWFGESPRDATTGGRGPELGLVLTAYLREWVHGVPAIGHSIHPGTQG